MSSEMEYFKYFKNYNGREYSKMEKFLINLETNDKRVEERKKKQKQCSRIPIPVTRGK